MVSLCLPFRFSPPFSLEFGEVSGRSGERVYGNIERAKRKGRAGSAYLAFPRQIVFLESTSIERYQQMGTAISILEGQAGFGHGGAGGCGGLCYDKLISHNAN